MRDDVQTWIPLPLPILTIPILPIILPILLPILLIECVITHRHKWIHATPLPSCISTRIDRKEKENKKDVTLTTPCMCMRAWIAGHVSVSLTYGLTDTTRFNARLAHFH